MYVKAGLGSPERQYAARWFDDSIERSLGWVGNKGKFYTDSQRRVVVDLFRQGQDIYRAMLQ